MASPQQKQSIHFIYLTDPTKDSAISSHRAAKSHAARHGHARVRRQRMNDFHQKKDKREGDNQAPHASASGSDSTVSVRRAGPAEASSSSHHANEGGREIILYPPRPSQPLVLETTPVSSLPKNLYSVHGLEFNKTEQYLLHHYVTWVIPFGKRHCRKYTNSDVWKRFMLRELIPLALSNPGLLTAILLAACRSLFKQDQNNYYVELATFYKLACLRSMSQQLAAEDRRVGDPEIAQAALLAADELNIGDRSTSKQHMDAAKRMVDMKGGNDKLGLNGFLSALVDTLTCAIALQNPIDCHN
ncbi:uncharacterized protein TrAtP1_005180 [Trichoderma atroviride]|uniref:Uncharacterized protein n=1 Tax=Hypocrea atroviridis (strain ATCC 20476 / IMI 206040) TaxID=452589 RepID=G9NFM8_HYPAI|nr:uncharacterized protein TRIATDRAFT_303674 [Trichoderma atroviride IMI 206040]EHK50743.1 hypothetical protein TRIATDRAFT_303674 [Trichoderma atroviride IMI 206040]UKZ63958.1 hypothetical protein TrAtP1_005180 [Trichoderma atroviride]